MAMNSPSGPIEATRNASMITAVMVAHDREKTRDPLDERELDRIEQEEMARTQTASRNRRGVFRRLLDRLPFI